LENISIAIDGGHSMFKIRAALSSSPATRISLQIPTVVMPAIRITNEQTRVLAESDTVEMDGEKYFFGETALRQTRSDGFTGQNVNWIETVQHDVLVLGTWRKVMHILGDGPANIHLVMGLPAKYYVAQKDILRQRVEALLRPRLRSGQRLHILIQSQADAPLQWLSITGDGAMNLDRNLDTENWGVIEIGHFTTDFAMSLRGSMVEHAVASCAGLNTVYDALSAALAAERLPTDLDTVELALRTREIKMHGRVKHVTSMVDGVLSAFKSTLLDEANRVFGGKAAVLDGIVIGGGGAELLFPFFKSRFPTAIGGDEPRMMVAEGFCRLGLMSLACE
jgi:plasmid segregation protein ParM